MYVNRKGFVTFDGPDQRSARTLDSHFSEARISVLYGELSLTPDSRVSYKQMANESVVVTWQRVDDSDFQLTLRQTGEIVMSYARVRYSRNRVVGLSGGVQGVEIDFSASTFCKTFVADLSESSAPPLAARGFGEMLINSFDLQHSTYVFSAPDYSRPCLAERDMSILPVSPLGGKVLLFHRSYNYEQEIRFERDFRFPFAGVDHRVAFVNYNGFITFGTSQEDFFPTLRSHFLIPRVSALYGDFELSTEKSVISWKQLDDRVAVTYERVGGCDFQISLFSSGDIAFTYLGMAQGTTAAAVVGVSLGELGAVGDLTMQPRSCQVPLAPAQGAIGTAGTLAPSQAFQGGFDLEMTEITFSPPDYAPCATTDLGGFPVDPRGGQVLPFPHSYDSVQEVRFAGGFRFPFLGKNRSNAFVSYNGYITFDEPDDLVFPSLRSHFFRPRISALYADLDLDPEATLISWRQLDDRATITFQGVSGSDFQVSLFADGRVSTAYLSITRERETKVVGVSSGTVGPVVDLSMAASCPPSDAAPAPAQPAGAAWGIAEVFSRGMDLGASQVSFSAAEGYSPCVRYGVRGFPVDPRGGAVLLFEHSYEWTEEIRFLQGFSFPFGGKSHASAYVNRHGFITFESEAEEVSPSLRSHFARPRLSALYGQLDLSDTETLVSWRQVSPALAAITFEGVSGSSFQVALGADGSVAYTYVDVSGVSSGPYVAGVSLGVAGAAADLSVSPGCGHSSSSDADAEAGAAAVVGVAEAFDMGFDLERTVLRFSPGPAARVCLARGIDALPVRPDGGVPVELPRWEDAPSQIAFGGDFRFPFAGRSHAAVYVSRQGFIAFSPEERPVFPSLRSHYAEPRISVLYSDLRPGRDQLASAISWKQLEDSAAITWHGVQGSDFQAVLFGDGTVELAYLTIGVDGTKVVGLSSGSAGPVVDLSSAPACTHRSRSVTMSCPPGHTLETTSSERGMRYSCSDGSSMTCEIEGGATVRCTALSEYN